MKKDKHLQSIPGACSCMTLTSKTGKHYWFRTCDIDTEIWRDGAHVVKQTAGDEILYCDGKRENSLYHYIGMTYNSINTWLLDGVNEHGLTGGLLMLEEGTSVDKEQENRMGYIGMELITKILSCCKNVEEVITLADKIYIKNIPYKGMSVSAMMHYFFTDCSGNEVILEATNQERPGILNIFRKDEILGVMTNSPSYEKQLQNLSWFLSQSWEMKQGSNGQAITELFLDGRRVGADENKKHISLNGIFPGSYSSHDRFIRLTVFKALNNSGNSFEDKDMLALGSGIMNVVCEPHSQGLFHYRRIDKEGKIIGQKNSFTQYIVMYDMAERKFFMKKYDETVWNQYSLKEIRQI